MSVSDQERKAIAAAEWSGMSAVLYVTDPERWPGFAAFAEQWMPGSRWDEADRLHMRQDAEILRRLAEMAEQLPARMRERFRRSRPGYADLVPVAAILS